MLCNPDSVTSSRCFDVQSDITSNAILLIISEYGSVNVRDVQAELGLVSPSSELTRVAISIHSVVQIPPIKSITSLDTIRPLQLCDFTTRDTVEADETLHSLDKFLALDIIANG
jgi:hypothetical protein